jgi:hypothetical protein
MLIITLLITMLRTELHAHRGTSRRCFASEWNSHSDLSRLDLYHDARTLQRVQSPFQG